MWSRKKGREEGRGREVCAVARKNLKPATALLKVVYFFVLFSRNDLIDTYLLRNLVLIIIN